MSLALRPQPIADDRQRRARDGAKAASAETRLERFSKLLPADVIAIYLPTLGLVALVGLERYAPLLIAGSTALVPLLLFLDARSAGDRVLITQYVVRTLTFLLWAFLISPSVAPAGLEPPVTSIAAIVVPISGELLVRAQLRPW